MDESGTSLPRGPRPHGAPALRREPSRTVIALSVEAAPGGGLPAVLELELPADGAAADPAADPWSFRHRLADLSTLEVAVDGARASAAAPFLERPGDELATLRLALRPGVAEATGTTSDGAPFSVRLAVEPGDGPEIAVTPLEPRVYAPARLPAPLLPGALLRAAAGAGRVADGRLLVDPLPALLRRGLAPLGWKVPRTGRVRLARARPGTTGLELLWSAGEAWAPGPDDAELATHREGTRAFPEVEELLASGLAAEALAALRARGEEARAHPFAAARLLALLAGDPAGHDEALALARAWEERRPGFPPALLAEAAVLLHRGDGPGAAACHARLAVEAAGRGEVGSALLAAEACYAAAGDGAAEAVARAAGVALGLDPDHLPSRRAVRDRGAGTGVAGEEAAALDERAAEAHRAGDARTEARALLARAGVARERGEADAALQLALAGEAALDAGLPVEAEAALRTSVALGLTRDEARAAWGALARLAREHRDAASERAALVELVRAAPTGERPALLVRRARLELASGDLAAARAAAAEALALAPGDLAAVDAGLEVARAGDDAAEVARLLERRAALEPAEAGPSLLERARLLAALGRAEESERALGEALTRLPPERALADEHAALRRRSPPPVGALPWGAPLERYAARVPDAAEAARALRDAVALARAQGDRGAALRAARRAHAREADAGFETGVLADLLHAGGAIHEALHHLRPLLSAGPAAAEPDGAARRLATLAELAEEVGDVELCLSALDHLLGLRPHDADALEWRFRVDPDRTRAAARLAEGASGLRSRRRRSLLLARAAASARAEGRDPGRAGELLDLARRASEGAARLRAEVEETRLAAARAHHAADPAADDLLAALAETAVARRATGDEPGAARLLEEAAAMGARMGRPVEAAAALATLAEQARERGDAPAAARLARRAARGLRDGGDAAGAERWLRRALDLDPADEGGWNDLEALALSRGDAGAPLLAEVLSLRASRAEGAARAEALVALARVLRGPGRDPEGALSALREALSAVPGETSAQAELERLLATTGRHAELGALLAARAAGEPQAEERSRLRLRAAEILMDGGDEAARDGAAEALRAVLAEESAARGAVLEAAGRLAALGRGDEASGRLLELARTDPADGAASQALARALAGRPGRRRDAFVALADGASGPARAAHLREAAAAAEEDGDAWTARDLRRAAYLAAPADEAAFREALGLAAGDVEAARAVLAARAGAVPADAPACHRTLGDLLLAAGRAAEAAGAYEACLGLDPADPSALEGLAEARAAAGDAPGALAAARRRVEVAAERGDAALRREALETGAALAGRLGDAGADAAALLEDLCATRLAEGSTEADALVDRTVGALARAGENARAEALLGLAARGVTGGRRAELLWRLADAAEARGDRDAARAAWNEALAADPDPRRRARRIDALRDKRDPVTWSAALEQVVAGGDGAPELLLELGRARARSGDVAGSVEAYSRLLELGPDVPGRDEALAVFDEQRARQGDERAAARVHARRAAAARSGAAAAAEWLASAGALERAGADDGEVRAALTAAADASPDDPVPSAALASFLERSGDAVGAARAWLAVALRSTGEPAAQASLTAARLLEGAGLPGEAERAWGAAAHARPSSWPARRRLAERASARGDFQAALSHLTAAARREVADEEMPDYLRALARAREGCGRDHEAEAAWLELLARDPSDVEAFEGATARLLAAGRADEWLALAARHEAGRAADPERRLALRRRRARLLASLGRAEAAAGAWRAALDLAPDDAEALAALAPGAGAPPVEPVPLAAVAPRLAAVSPLEAARDAARRDPADLEALAALRDAAGESATLAPAGRARTALRELAWVADALLRRTRGEDAPPGSPAVAEHVPPGIRSRAAVAGADGPLARTLALLAPWLEPLFPVNLARHGVEPKDRLTPATGAAYLVPLDAATRALGARPLALFLGRRPGVSATLENTRPPSLVLGADVGALDPAAQAFLVGWGAALATAGGVLPSRFAARDLRILLELACRLSGVEPAAPALPAERARAFLTALERSVPPSARAAAAELAPAALEELGALDPAALAAALSETAARVALLHRGDLHAALTALGALDRPTDLARFALSEPYLELRGMILGWT